MNLPLLITARSAPNESLSDGGPCLLEAPLSSEEEEEKNDSLCSRSLLSFSLCVVPADGHGQRVTVWKDVWLADFFRDVMCRKNEGGRMAKN